MTIETLLAETAWRLRACLGSSIDEQRASDEEAIAALLEAEHQAARHQLPQFAASRYSRCAYVDPSGWHCTAPAITPPLYGFASRFPNAHTIHRRACAPFIGGLCASHVAHLVVPPAHWWPENEAAVATEREEIIHL